jgi:hypothetical protein
MQAGGAKEDQEILRTWKKKAYSSRNTTAPSSDSSTVAFPLISTSAGSITEQLEHKSGARNCGVTNLEQYGKAERTCSNQLPHETGPWLHDRAPFLHDSVGR